MTPPLVLSTSAYAPMQGAFVAALGDGALVGRVERRSFPDGERYLRLEDSIEARDVLILGGTPTDVCALEIFDLGCTTVAEGARTLTLVLPYFGYSTMERATRRGEVVTARCRARLLSAIPRAPGGNTAFLLDLHADGIPHYFGDAIVARHVYAKPLLLPAIAALGGDVVVAATDAGRAKWVESLANEAGRPAAFVYKRRMSGSETRVTGVNADVQGRTVALYDDMVRTGGSLVQAAEAYRAAGASRVVALTTHLLPTPGAIGRIRASGAIERLIATDSHPGAMGHSPEFVEVLPVVSILARAAGSGRS